jgi:hypothetical protein
MAAVFVRLTLGGIEYSVLSPDQKTIYVTGEEKGSSIQTVWGANTDGSNPEKFVDNCGTVTDADPGGKYLLGVVWSRWPGNTGIYEVSISDRKCSPLLPGVVSGHATIADDGESFLYAVVSRGEVTIYCQPWKDGKTIGAPQVAFKVPLAFSLWYAEHGAYDFSRDLSTTARRSAFPEPAPPNEFTHLVCTNEQFNVQDITTPVAARDNSKITKVNSTNGRLCIRRLRTMASEPTIRG